MRPAGLRRDSIVRHRSGRRPAAPGRAAGEAFPPPLGDRGRRGRRPAADLLDGIQLGPKQGTIQVALESPAAGVTVSIDGKPFDPEQLEAPLTLPVGPHRLEAGGKGLVAFQGTLPVFEGANPPFPVKLVAVPSKPASSKPEADEAVAASKAEPQPEVAGAEVAADVKPAEVAGDMAAEKVEADPAVVGDMAAEKVEADPNILGDMAAEKVEADPNILGPEPKAGPKANTTLKQIASDPETYLDASVIPSDLLIIDTGVVGGPVGKRPGPLDLHLVVKSREGGYRDFVKSGTSFEILLTNETAAAIRDQVRSGNLVGGEYPAIVKFKKARARRTPRGLWASSSGSSCSSTSTPGPSSTGNPSITRCSRSCESPTTGPRWRSERVTRNGRSGSPRGASSSSSRIPQAGLHVTTAWNSIGWPNWPGRSSGKLQDVARQPDEPAPRAMTVVPVRACAKRRGPADVGRDHRVRGSSPDR